MALPKPSSSILHRLKSLSFLILNHRLHPPKLPTIVFTPTNYQPPSPSTASSPWPPTRTAEAPTPYATPPLSPSRHQPQQQRRPHTSPSSNPNVPKLPDHVFLLSSNRLACHNNILKLIGENDLDEASLYTRHSVYSNCRPTIFTCNAVLTALLRQCRYSDFLSLHRFITQAGIAIYLRRSSSGRSIRWQPR